MRPACSIALRASSGAQISPVVSLEQRWLALEMRPPGGEAGVGLTRRSVVAAGIGATDDQKSTIRAR